MTTAIADGSVPVGYTAYEREFCGWLTIEELTSPATVSLENLADSKKAYKIVSSDKNQYFTLENRQQTGVGYLHGLFGSDDSEGRLRPDDLG